MNDSSPALNLGDRQEIGRYSGVLVLYQMAINGGQYFLP